MNNAMACCLRNLTAGAAIVACTGASAQGGDAQPDAYTKMKAVQIYIVDGSAVIVAQACTESAPDYMSRFLPRFTAWRASNVKQIALGATLSAQFKDPKGEPMDPAVVGRGGADRLRTAPPDERNRECEALLKDVSTDE